MIGPVSGTGRAMMASLQQAMAKGMPPDQAIQYVKSMATQGVAPMADLYAMMNQFQRLKQQPVQAPQTPPTIRDQLNMAEAQQRQQQMAMQQGLGGMPAPVMEQAQFAGGGIVAFAEGGETEREMSTGEFLLPGAYEESTGELKPWAAGIASVLRPKRSGTSVVREAQALASQGRTQEAMQLLAQNNIDPRQAFGESAPRAATPAPAPAPAPRPAAAPTPRPPAASPNAVTPFSMSEFRREPENILEAARDVDLAGERLTETLPRTPDAGATTAPAPRRAVVAARGQPQSNAVAKAAPEPTREDMESREYDRIQAFRKREGLGAARQEMRQFLSDENNKLTEQFGRDRMMAFAEAGFKMAAAASRPGATFLGALAEGAMSGTQALRGIQKEMDANRRGLKESMLKLREAEELEKEGDFKSAMQIAQQARTEMFQRQQHEDKLKVDYAQIAATVENSRRSAGATIRAAEISAGARGQAGAISPEDVMRNKLSVLNDRAGALNKYINDFRTSVFDPTPEQIAAYEGSLRELANVEAQRSQLTGLSGATSLSGGQNFSGFTARLKE